MGQGRQRLRNPGQGTVGKIHFLRRPPTAYEFTIARLNSAEGTEAPTVRSGRFTENMQTILEKTLTVKDDTNAAS